MKNRTLFFTIGLIVLLPLLALAQDKSPVIKNNGVSENKLIDGETNLQLSQQKPSTKIEKKGKSLDGKNGLYHIVITTDDHKSESIWVELDHGEQKFVTIRLDNGSKKSVSIQLNDIKPIGQMRVGPYDKLSLLTLQPISF